MSERNKISDLKKLAIKIRKINTDNGWNVWQLNDFIDNKYKFGFVIALIHSEVSEALEWYRTPKLIHPITKEILKELTSEETLDEIKEEMADIIIRVLDWWSTYDDDPMDKINKKLEKNKNRGFRHGGKKI